jgi:hypothetical protein
MLDEATAARLDRLRHHATRYEVALALPDGRTMLVCYSPRKSRAGLLDCLRSRGPAILPHVTGMPEDATVTYHKARGFVFSDGTRVYWSGRTQRDAILSGELDYIGNPPAA